MKSYAVQVHTNIGGTRYLGMRSMYCGDIRAARTYPTKQMATDDAEALAKLLRPMNHSVRVITIK